MSFKARFPGKCRNCARGISPGDDIIRRGEKDHIHVSCANPEELKEDLRKDMEFREKREREAQAREQQGGMP